MRRSFNNATVRPRLSCLSRGAIQTRAGGRVCRVQGVRHGPQRLAGVVVVQALLGLGETVAGQIPNPHCAVGHHQHFGRVRQAVPLRFGEELFAQSLHAAAGHHRAATQNGRPPAGRRAGQSATGRANVSSRRSD